MDVWAPAAAPDRVSRTAAEATAWVESPLQLLSAVEAHALGRTARRTTVVVRVGSAALHQTALAAVDLGLPDGLTLVGEADAAAPWDLRGDAPWVVGDAFSGVVQRALVLHRPARVVLVDDGLAALHLLALLADPSQPALVRARAGLSPGRGLLGQLAGRRLREAARDGRLEAVTSLPVPSDVAAGVEAAGLQLTSHSFGWLRSRPAADAPAERTVVLGTALVGHGLVRPEPYLEFVRSLSRVEPVAYYPHRRESPELLHALSEEPGVCLRLGRAPVEITLRGLQAAHRVVGLPSTALASLGALLAGRGVRFEPVDVPEDWWTPRAAAFRRSLPRSQVPAAA